MNTNNIGATGTFPKGKMNEYDEGGINVAIAKDNEGRIIVDFGTPVKWLAMNIDEALKFASALVAKCKE